MSDDYYRVWAQIDVDGIRENIKVMKDILPDDKKILAVIKANGYGHGAVELAKYLVDLADYYGLAIIEEAMELRSAGITKPLLILGHTSPAHFKLLLDYDICPTIYNLQEAEKLSQLAVQEDKVAKIHIKVDTGMSRIGFLCDEKNMEETIDTIVKISQLPNLVLEGLFSHYAKADEYDKTNALGQLERFKEVVVCLENKGINIPIKHISNSAGVMEMPNDMFDMVRPGITMYGLYPSDEVDAQKIIFTPAMSIYSHIVHIKEIEEGTSVGYGGTFIAAKTMKIATIPVGYADGYPRALSNVGRVIINGQYAPIVGRVCMDQFMVDVGHIEDVHLDDIVTLVGRDGESKITVEELAEPAASFNYEFVCNVGRRVPRVYVLDGEIVSKVDYLLD